jgi:drug/metabolite transporter (DMT)-like permease
VIYPLLFSVTKIAAEAGVPPIGFVFWHSLLAALGLLAICLVRRDLPGLSWAHLRGYLALGFLGTAAPVSLLAYVSAKLPAGLVTLVVVLSPLLTYVFALLLRMERRNLFSIAGIMLGLGGVLLVVVPSLSLPSPDMLGWLLLAFLAPVFFAATNISGSLLRPPAANSFPMAAGVMVASTVMMAPIALSTGQMYPYPGPAPEGAWTALAAAAVNGGFYVAFFAIVRRAGSVFVSQFNYLVILCGFGWGALLFGERHSLYVFGAAALMVLGLALHSLGMRRGLAARPASAND